MRTVKQMLRITGAVICFLFSFTLPLLTCIQNAGTHQKTEATVKEIEVHQPSHTSRKVRAATRTLRYTYIANGAEYEGSDPRHEVGASVKPGDKVTVMYRKGNPADSKVAEFGMYGLKATFTFLAISGYLFYSYFRNRR